MAPIIVAARVLPGYKYLLCSVLLIISYSSFSHLGLAMKDKKGTKRPRSPFAEGTPSPSDAKTPPLTLSGSPPPLGSPSEITLCCPRSPVFEQDGPSGNILVIELSSSSNEENFFAATARDTEFARRLFGDLNRDLLRPPGDDKVIVLSDFDKEEEAREETTADAKVAPYAVVKSSTPASSTANVDEDPRKMQDDNSDDLALGLDMGKSSGDGDEAGSP
jgi:hypothetical protein